jgi:3-oxoacyl-[acyl-carrier-protein] synthase-3
MGLDTIPCLDIRMQCSGFIYGLSIADAYIRSGVYRHVLVIGSEVQSTGLDRTPEGRTVGVLFGDGAGAVVVSAREEPMRGIHSCDLHTQGEHARILWNEEPTSNRRPRINPSPDSKAIYPFMEGKEVFKNAVTRMCETIITTLKKQQWRPEDVGLFIPHQANARIAQMVAQQLGIPDERMFINIHKYGNTTAGSIPIALAEAVREGRARPGDKLLLFGFGSGFTWGSVALTL